MKLFVWDFHGVLEKDNEKSVIDISNQALKNAGLPDRLTYADNERYYGLKWYQYFEKLLPQLTNAEHLALQAACFTYAEKNLHILANNIQSNNHADAVLTTITKAGHAQIMISNSRQSDLLWFLDTVDLRKHFDNKHIVG